MNALLIPSIIAIVASVIYSAWIAHRTWKEEKMASDGSEWGITLLVSGGVMTGLAANSWPIGIALGFGLIFLGFIALRR